MAKGHHKVSNYKFYGRFSWYVPGIGGMFMLMLMLLVGAVIGNVISVIFTIALGADAASSYVMLISYPVMFIPAMIYASVKSRNASLGNSGLMLDSSHFGKQGGFACALMAIIVTAAAAFCADIFTNILPDMPEALEAMMENMTQGVLWVNFLCVSIFAPFFEEWLCRGMVLRGLLGNGTKPVWAIVISAVFFAVIHLNPWQAIPAFILGCLFGYVYYRTGSLKLTMLMHFTNNTVALVLSNIPSLKDVDSWQALLPPQAYWPVFVLCIAIVAAVSVMFSRTGDDSPSGNCDRVAPLFGDFPE